MQITPPYAFSAVLLAAISTPWAVETIRSSTKSYTMARVIYAGGTSGWLGILALIAAAGGVLVPMMRHSAKMRRQVDLTLATAGTALHCGFGVPILSSRWPYAEWGPGFGFFLITIGYVAAGLLALRERAEVRP